MELSNLESDIAESEVKKASFKVVFVEKKQSLHLALLMVNRLSLWKLKMTKWSKK